MTLGPPPSRARLTASEALKIFTAKVKQHITKEELAAIDEEVEALVNDAVLKARAAHR
jgi:hypothetical protein